MKLSIVLKAVTLLFFISFISLFVLYQAGWLSQYFAKNKLVLQTSSNGGTINLSKPDSSTKAFKDSVLKKQQAATMINDYQKKKTKEVKTRTLSPKELKLMSSSKSIILFTPTTLDSLQLDSLRKIKP